MCFRDVYGPLLCVSDLYMTLYIVHGVCIGSCTVYIGAVLDTIQFVSDL